MTPQFTYPSVASYFSVVENRYWFSTKCKDFEINAIFMKPTVNVINYKNGRVELLVEHFKTNI